jgi:hypothetical protein
MPEHCPLLPGGAPARRAAAVVAFTLATTACGFGPGPFRGPVAPPADEAGRESGTAVHDHEAPGPIASARNGGAASLLEQGQALLIAGRHAEAVPPLEAYLVVGEHEPHRLAANWSLALVFLLPDSPVRDERRAAPLLDRIVEEHPASIEAVHARLLRGLLGDLSRSRATVEEQRRSISELNQLVEQLKQIDLSRRSGGGGIGIPPRPH